MKKIFFLLFSIISFGCFCQTKTDSLVGFNEQYELDHINSHGIDISKISFYMDLAKKRFINKKYSLDFYAPPIASLNSNPVLDCNVDNWGFENGTLNGWNQQGAVQLINNGVDPYGGFPWVYPNGGSFSAKVSSDLDCCKDGRLDKIINVPANGETLMSFHFAMSIFNYPHLASEAAKLWVEFYDNGGNLLSCPQYECYYSTDNGAVGVSNFVETPNPASFYNPAANGDSPHLYPVTYADWNTVTLDLSAYQGQQITVVFRVEWCIYGPDWAYVLLDVDCPVTSFEPTNICLDETSQGTLCGPDNMSTYTWYDSLGVIVGNDQCLNVNTTGTYILETAPLVECTQATLLTFDFIVYPQIYISYLLSDYNSNNISCNGHNDGSIEVDVNGGLPPYNYNWSTINPNSADQYNLYEGSYDLQVTDSKGCVFDTTFVLIEPTPLQTTISAISNYNGYHISCNDYSDGSINISASGSVPGYTFLWNNGETTQTISGISAGIYSVDVTDSSFCTASTYFNVIDPTLLESLYILSEINGYNVCNGAQDGYIDLLVSGSVPGYSYQWSNGDTIEDINGLSAGTYSYVVTDQNGCITSDTIEIIEPNINIQESAVDVSCFGATNGSVSVNVSGSTAPYYVFWNNNINSSLVSSGTYIYQIVDSIGCVYFDSLIVSEPDSFIVAENVVDVSCNGFNDGSISLVISGATPPFVVNWFGANIVNAHAGTYNYTIADSNNCYFSEIAIVNEPNQIDVLNQVVDPSCGNTNDGSVSLQISGGTPPYSIDWGGSNPNSLAIGNYVFVVNDDNNCADSNSVTLTSVSSIQVVSEITQISCNSFCDGSIDLTITGGVSPYTVDWFGVNPAFLCEGSVSYEIVDAIGCYFVENFQINSPDSVELNISQLGMQLEGIASGGVGPYSYEWFNDFGPLVNSQTVNITSNGSYYCIAIDVNHCQSDTVEYYYLETSIENLGVANLNIYPNPTDNILNIEFDSVNENDISLFFIDVLGQKICIEMIEKFKGNYNYKFDLQSFPHGVYILELRSGSEVYNKKIIRK